MIGKNLPKKDKNANWPVPQALAPAWQGASLGLAFEHLENRATPTKLCCLFPFTVAPHSNSARKGSLAAKHTYLMIVSFLPSQSFCLLSIHSSSCISTECSALPERKEHPSRKKNSRTQQTCVCKGSFDCFCIGRTNAVRVFFRRLRSME